MEYDQLFTSELREGQPTLMPFANVTRRSSDNKRTTVTINTDTDDRHGTVIDPNGGDLSNYNKNPIFLINHNENMVAGNGASIRVQNNQMIAEIDDSNWDLDDPDIAKWHNKVKKGIIRMASIGFIPKKIEFETDDGEELDNPVIREWEMLEFSFVSIGSNPEALVTERNASLQRSNEIEELKQQINELKKSIPTKQELKDLLAAKAAPAGSGSDAGNGNEPAPAVPGYAAPRSDNNQQKRLSNAEVRQLIEQQLKRNLGKA